MATGTTLAAVAESAIPLPVVLDTECHIQITGLAGLEPTTYGLGNRPSALAHLGSALDSHPGQALFKAERQSLNKIPSYSRFAA